MNLEDKSPYELVELFLDTVGVQGTDEDIDLYKKLLKSEVTEMTNALVDNDIKEVLDGIGDTMFVCLALVIMCERTGRDQEEAFFDMLLPQLVAQAAFGRLQEEEYFLPLKRVALSNLSKFDTNWDEAALTQSNYNRLGVELHQAIRPSGYIVSKVFYATDAEKYPKWKVMKSSSNYKEPELDDLISNY